MRVHVVKNGMSHQRNDMKMKFEELVMWLPAIMMRDRRLQVHTLSEFYHVWSHDKDKCPRCWCLKALGIEESYPQ